jgi:hypothetical protein
MTNSRRYVALVSVAGCMFAAAAGTAVFVLFAGNEAPPPPAATEVVKDQAAVPQADDRHVRQDAPGHESPESVAQEIREQLERFEQGRDVSQSELIVPEDEPFRFGPFLGLARPFLDPLW